MKFFPKINSKKTRHENFVVVDIGLGRVNIAIFNNPEKNDPASAEEDLEPKFVGVGRRSFSSVDTLLDATLEATDSLGAVVDHLPTHAVVGVCGGELTALTTIAKYNRESPDKIIDQDELSVVLQKIADRQKNGLSVFFSTVTGATIDGNKVTNPVGLKGEKAEINCFVAYKAAEELALYDQIIEELEIKAVNIMPSAFALNHMLGDSIAKSSLLLRVGLDKSEASQVHGGHLVRITNFEIGSKQLEFYNFAVEAILETQDPKERSSELWLYSDSDEVDLEEVARHLKGFDWKKRFGLSKEFSVKILPDQETFGADDLAVLALSREEKQ